MKNELADKVIDFCEALRNFQAGEHSKMFIDSIINSDKFKAIWDCAHDVKIYGHKERELLTKQL